jgi:hypothetical protein
MWRESFEHGVGITDPHSFEEQERYLLDEVVPGNMVRVARLGGRMVGFRRGNTGLHLAPVRSQGILRPGDRHMPARLGEGAVGGLVVVVRLRAQRGRARLLRTPRVRIVARGYEPNWKLDDLKYEWPRSRGRPGV